MSDEETIHVADVSEGVGGDSGVEPGSPVELPVVEILTGRGFVTGKSGSGKSNTASVFIENLLDNGFPVMIVDTDGEYYGLKEEYEILHAGADEECDIVVSSEHAEKLAALALEQNVPIVLDVSGYLEEREAKELLLEVVKQLFAKEKKLKKPFLLVLEECHEYIPEGGGMDETGKMLIKVGKRGRKHGLGIVGISQRPADVKKDFITQCDWLCWHRLTWDNDTTVVSRILGSTYADAIEDMGDGEAFLMTDWNESVRRIQFHRKETFDAGATPGLDDFERPELKSVSGDLVAELRTISDEQARRESELADLRQELDEKRRRIEQLERELEEARDLSDMADTFAQAMLQKSAAPYRGGAGEAVRRSETADQSALDDYERSGAPPRGPSDPDGDADRADAADEVASDGDVDEATDDDPAADIDPVSREDVSEESLRFDATVEFGTREALVDELRERVESLPDLSVSMLRHYRREGECEPIAAHIAAGGDGDAEHAYARHRPIRKSGLVRHVGGGRYAYAIPDLIREAYAGRIDETAVADVVGAVETAFVPPAESEPDLDDDVLERSAADAVGASDDPLAAVDRNELTVAELATGLSERAKAFARGEFRTETARDDDPASDGDDRGEDDGGGETAESENAAPDEENRSDSTEDADAGTDAGSAFDPAADDAEIVDADG